MRKLFVLLFVILVAAGFYFVLMGQPEAPPPVPQQTVAGSATKLYTVYVNVPRELEVFAKQSGSAKTWVFLSKKDDHFAYPAQTVEYSNSKMKITAPLPADADKFYDQILVVVKADAFALMTQKLPLERGFDSNKPDLYFYSLRMVNIQTCESKAGDLFTINVKVSPEAKSKFRTDKKYAIVLSYAKAGGLEQNEYRDNLGAVEVTSTQLTSPSFTLNFPVPDLVKKAAGSAVFEIAECGKNTPLISCFNQLDSFEGSTAFVLAPVGLTPPPSICPGDQQSFVLAPASPSLFSILHREMPDLLP